MGHQKIYFIFEMDADFSHNPQDLMILHEACLNGADLAIGSRYKSGVNVVNWPMGRVLMSYFASIYVRLVTGMKIYDTTAGFKCYRGMFSRLWILTRSGSRDMPSRLK